VKFREIVRLIEEDGWQLTRQRGSHRQYSHPTKPGRVTIAGHPNKDCAERHRRQYPSSSRTEEAELMSEYLVVIENEGNSWGAYVPDLPGVGVAGDSRDEVEQLIREAIELHLEGLREAGDPIPRPAAVATTLIEIPAA
jgi:predicted RNA binding protein YcfA (HicA-like mRNA interferase family)/predicted RNase H-like HicB family nuclease